MDIVIDSLEMGLDTLWEAGDLEQIPMLDWIAKSIKVVGAVCDRMLIKKIVRFLKPISDVDPEEANHFATRMEDGRFRKRVEENLYLLLDSLDDMAKAVVIGRMFRALMRKEVTYDDYQRLAGAILRMHLADLSDLMELSNGVQPPGLARQELMSTGLIEIVSVPGIRDESVPNRVEITLLGQAVLPYTNDNE